MIQYFNHRSSAQARKTEDFWLKHRLYSSHKVSFILSAFGALPQNYRNKKKRERFQNSCVNKQSCILHPTISRCNKFYFKLNVVVLNLDAQSFAYDRIITRFLELHRKRFQLAHSWKVCQISFAAL